MQLRALKQIEVLTAEEVLRDSVRTTSQTSSDAGPLPHVRVTLGSHVFSGIPVRIEDRRNEPWLVLVERDEIAYLPLRSITTVVVRHVPQPAPPEPPTKFVLERTRNEIQAIAQSAGWVAELVAEWPAAPTEDDRRSIESALGALRTILPALTADALGREAASPIKRICLVPASGRELKVTRAKASLTIVVGMSADLRDATLRPLIEKQL